MKRFTLALATAITCGLFGFATLVSCSKDKEDDEIQTEDYERGLYSDLDLPDDGSNGSKYGITDEDFANCAADLNKEGYTIEAVTLKAVVLVETGGKGGFLANGKPTILFEGHIFWQQLRCRGINPQDHVKGNEDILYQKLDKTKYKGGVEEWDRLNRAIEINEDAALCSASFGMFQLMGYQHLKCGCDFVQDFASKMEESEVSQLTLFANFLKSNPAMLKALSNHDWVSFARLYNGPTYAQNRYDDKLAKAYYSLKG